ncbi:hypothetical protein B7494_g872 [Chlorociboria aeruginascens]|nr:hypothetical protein B7494_g872 [Chlorociboria aeruginascens]
MPSRGNPNVPNKLRRVANRAKVQRRNAINKITKNPRGTARSSVLHPTSGPLAPVSGKKARKIEKAKNHARQRAVERAMQNERQVQMTVRAAHVTLRRLLASPKLAIFSSERPLSQELQRFTRSLQLTQAAQVLS